MTPGRFARYSLAVKDFPELLARAPDAVTLHDARAFVIDANEQACRTLGYERAELVGMHVRDFVDGLDGDRLEGLVRVMKERGFASFSATHRRKDGSRFPVEVHLALLRQPGDPVVVAFAHDVSDRDATRRALDQSEARYRRLVELLPDAVITHVGGRITFANAAAARLVGAARAEELVGTPALDRVHPDSRQAVGERLERVARGESVPLIEEKLVRLDGTPIAAEVIAAPLGRETVVVARDLSERKRADAERAALQDRLRQAEKLEAIGTLAGGVAHDFNNVLAAILGHADALAAELPAGSVGREDAERIAAAARRAKGVVGQILAFARRRPIEAQPVDVARSVRDELALVRAATPASVEIVSRIEAAAGAVRADPTHIHQVLLNLCANARDAMAGPGGRLVIEVAREELPGRGSARAPAGLAPGPYVRLSVGDSGHGMDAPTRARAFEPYFTTKDVGDGSGLGLSVVHGIALALGGAVGIETAPGRGTTVDVWLPRLGDAAARRERETPTPAGRGRVLLVDDDPPVQLALRRMLEALGYDVTAAADGDEALAVFRSDPGAFDAVLTDQTLPRLCGDALVRELLALRPGLPVLICTGYSERVDEERAREIGAAALLMKPLDLAQLGAALRAAMPGRNR